MPLVTTRASVAYGAGFGKVLGSAGAVDLGVMEAIGMVQVGSGGSATLTFSSIPSTYKHLQVRMLTRGSIAATGTNVNVRFNSDSSSVYRTHFLSGNGASVPAEDSGATDLIYLGFGASANSSANVFGTSVWDILDYTDTNKFTTCRSLCGFDNNGSGSSFIISGLWRDTSVINAITIFPNSGTFAQYSQFALYGIKGA